jgi:pullulanase
MDKLAAVAIFTSQGVPFIQAGQEFLRTKGGDHNSYDKPDAVNMIRWRDKAGTSRRVRILPGPDCAYAGRIACSGWETAEQVRQAVKFLDELGLAASSGCLAF